MNFLKSLVQKFTGKPVDWDELEESLIRADLGVPMTLRIIKALQERAQRIHDHRRGHRGSRARRNRANPADRAASDHAAAGKTESALDRRRERNRQDNLNREARAFLQTKPAQRPARRRGHLSRRGDRAARHLGRTARRRDDSRSIQRGSGRTLLRSLRVGRSQEHRVSDLRYRGPTAHEKQFDGRAEQGETQPREAGSESAA